MNSSREKLARKQEESGNFLVLLKLSFTKRRLTSPLLACSTYLGSFSFCNSLTAGLLGWSLLFATDEEKKVKEKQKRKYVFRFKFMNF